MPNGLHSEVSTRNNGWAFFKWVVFQWVVDGAPVGSSCPSHARLPLPMTLSEAN